MTTPPPRLSLAAIVLTLLLLPVHASAWDTLPVEDDPLVRMPGTQPGEVSLESPGRCLNCHAGYNQAVEPGFNWQGSMMAQAARDPLFWSTVAVAAQDSIWVLGRPNATDICLRCHSPEGWLEGRSDPTNGSRFVDSDHDGVHCVACHTMVDPFFEDTYQGLREGDDWAGYWDEATSLPATSAATTRDADWAALQQLVGFNGDPLYLDRRPVHAGYTENGGGQYYVDTNNASSYRASFADAAARHNFLYSRYHKSRYFCSSCHDVSNPVLANLGHNGQTPGTGEPLPTETDSAFSYGHVERTFSEFMLSAYGRGDGAVGLGYFGSAEFRTPLADNRIATCQHCHMAQTPGRGANKNDAVYRPDGMDPYPASDAHPDTAQPVHDLTGGNAWIPWILATVAPDAPNGAEDAENIRLLGQGPAALTLDLNAGQPLNYEALMNASARAVTNLQRAAAVEQLTYDPDTGALSFRVQNQTGHKLPSGYPEGRRVFLNVQAWDGDALIYELNPYDPNAATLRGLPDAYSPNSPDLLGHEVYDDRYVYEMHASSSLTDEAKTFHFALADGRQKDNRIPPLGFDIDAAAERMIVPVWEGAEDPGLFSDAEYTGGYDAVALDLPSGATRVIVSLYYQTTSREYMEFLRDEINGTADTLASPTPSGEPNAYIAMSDPFFSQLRAWGTTMYDLWLHNQSIPGAAPVLMVQEAVDAECIPSEEVCDGVDNNCNDQIDEVCDCVHGNTQPCGTDEGECVAGTETCEAGTWGACDGETTPVDEVCDGLDNDCDGQDDNGVLNACGECGPVPGEVCDGLDNDCDDATDEDLTPPVCTLQQGVCMGATATCLGVDGWSTCGAAEYGPNWTAEEDNTYCDGLDNDCDNTTDEACDCVDGDTQPCGTDEGLCVAGTETCDLGAWGTCDGETTPVDEVCDGLDNDCDGVDDNGVLNACGECGPVPGEVCDGLDNDCDDATDEDLTPPACVLQQGVCEGAVRTCAGADGWSTCGATEYGDTWAPEEDRAIDGALCDGLDNDCDGRADETCDCVNGDTRACGTDEGECVAGTETCEAGTWGECDGEVASDTEICDGLDNDCDGQDDNDISAPGCDLQEGVCAGATATCLGADGWSTCGTDEYGPDWTADEGDAHCDGLDNDCDGNTDEGCDCEDGDTQPCGPDDGLCVAGTQTCDQGAWGTCEDATGPVDEVCDGLDNDCDGVDDNGVLNACDECGETPAEVCDGLDNDCDDATDEDLTPPACDLQQGVCTGAAATCLGVDGWSTCGAEAYGPNWVADEGDTHCDGLDNDCDGTPDEGCDCEDGDTRPCGTDEGLCVAGTETCDLGAWGACDGETTPVDEVCDGFDNDCDGVDDNGVLNACGECGPVPGEVCDGLDNDCDDATDEDLTPPACTLQQGVCVGATATCAGTDGWSTCSAAEYGPNWAAEEGDTHCDGLDNDCDGTTDEGCSCEDNETQPCGTDEGECVAGTQSCVDGAWGTCEDATGPADEVCDGLDNDCDGTVDNGVLNACGECGEVPEEICDGIDNDCDGTPDQGMDSDGDGYGDACDVCPSDPDPEQGDSDGDGLGDACDACPSQGVDVDATGCPAGDDVGPDVDAGPDVDVEPDTDAGPDVDATQDTDDDVDLPDAAPDVPDAAPDVPTSDSGGDADDPGEDVDDIDAGVTADAPDTSEDDPQDVDSPDETGCACSATSGSPGDAAWLIALLGLALWVRRRR